MKTTKRILALVLTIVALVSVMAVGASAANTTNRNFRSAVDGDSFTYVSAERKEDSSTVFLYLNSVPGTHIYVQACGCNSSGTGRKNLTLVNGSIVTSVVCREKLDYSIHTDIYEWGYSYATLGFKLLIPGNTGVADGYWSPDSSGSYFEAT